MNATVTEENVGRFLNDIDRVIELRPYREVSYRTLAKKIEAHFDKPLESFKIDGLKKIGRYPVERRVEIHRGENETRDGLIFDADFLLVDNEGFCYTVSEAASVTIILTEEELENRKEKLNREHLAKRNYG